VSIALEIVVSPKPVHVIGASRFPRKIVAFKAEASVKARTIQGMVGGAPVAENYFTDSGAPY